MSWSAANPYRGWTMVERRDGLYMTRDNREYVPVVRPLAEGSWGRGTIERFHRMVDEREGRKA